MGVAFKAERGWQQGVRVAFSMGLHNACEGLAIALVLTSSGFSNAAGAFWAIITHLPQVPGAMLFYLGAQHLAPWRPVLLGWAGASIKQNDENPDAVRAREARRRSAYSAYWEAGGQPLRGHFDPNTSVELNTGLRRSC